MKKYLMIGFAAIAFASCSNHDFETMTPEQIVKAEYDAKFIATFGQPSRSQTWGFGASTRAFTRSNPGETYRATHEYDAAHAGANCNANEWADASKDFGGWVVPDPLTGPQKELVRKYFQSVKPLSYEDPHFRHFFVQQVYTGGSAAPETGNKESNAAASGTVTYNGANMNLLTVGEGEYHINNFNAGGYGVEKDSGGAEGATGVTVLNNGESVGGDSHQDQIMLMVNIDDTSCFGYYNTGSSEHRNDKAALVSWKTIAQWAVEQGLEASVESSILNDKWDRSFLGFDFELLREEDILLDQYVVLSNIPGNQPEYVWDGTKVMKIGTKPADAKEDLDITSQLANASKQNGTPLSADGNGVWTWDGQNFDVSLDVDATGYTKLVVEYAEPTPHDYNFSIEVDGSANYDQNRKSGETKVEYEINATKLKALHFMNGNGTFKIKSIYLTSGANEPYYESNYILAGTNQIPYYYSNTNMYGGETIPVTEEEMKITVDGKVCINLPKFQQLYDDGYRPVDGAALQTWAKWAGGDGYYSDWIVTLHEAQRITPPDDYTPDYQGRIMAEDLTVNNDPTGKKSDWDFNDVVFDWDIHDGKAYIKLWAAGGTLPLTIGGELNAEGTEVVGGVEVHGKFGVSTNTMVNTGLAEREAKEFVLNDGITYTNGDANAIKLYVKKNGQWIEITAEQGEPAGKFNCEVGTEWCDEYVDIRRVYPQFAAWVANEKVNWTTLEAERAVLTDKNLENNDVYPLIEE